MSKPTGDKPALLTHREVETVFHEFGHLLHHLLSDVSIKSLAGVNVPWDFVELPSQIMENFCWDRESLDFFAKHYETGETIPDELFEKMVAARNYMSATAFMRQFIAWETRPRASPLIPKNIEGVIWMRWTRKSSLVTKRNSLLRVPVSRGPLTISSLHPSATRRDTIPTSGPRVLDADAFTRFRDEGVLNTDTGMSFRAEVLSKGNSRPVDESYRAFMGRDPEQTALLERSGLA